MNDIAISDVRNFAIMGHTGCGKTSLVDALLFKLGLNDRLGSVSAGSSMADYTDEEKNRKITLYAKPFNGVLKTGGKSVNFVFIDTPGYMDFFGQVIAAARAADAALIAVDAAAGIQVGTHRVWKCCEKRKLARGIVITGLDRDNTDFPKALSAIQAAFGPKCLPVLVPLADKSGVADVLAGKDIPPALAKLAEESKTNLIERAAETDDALIEKFLGGESLTPDELSKGLRKAVATGGVVPVFVCLPLKNIGITETLEAIIRLFPSPADVAVTDSEGKPVPTGATEPFVGQVWRTVNDSFVGQLAFVRVLGGTVKSDSEVQNLTKNQKERIASLLVVNGKKQSTATSASAGDIIALTKLKAQTAVSDVLGAVGHKAVLDKIVFPSPTTFMSVTAKSQADEDKIGTALARVSEEDPTLKVEHNTETKEIVLSGLGDVHIDVTVERMKGRSNVEVLLNTPKVPYHETVTSKGEGHYKHKKQSGGRGQYGEVYLRVMPKKKDDPEWFEDAIVGGVIPGNFVPAVQKGVAEGMTAGVLAGFPVTDVKSSVYDGSYHEVDSSEISFKIAGSRAFREAMTNAKPVLLEPIMTVKVMVPDNHLGDVNGDLNHKRGRILGMGSEEGLQVITAEVPQAELFRYAAELRSMTAGQGTFELEFSRYDIVPSNVAQKVIAAAEKNKKEEKE